MTYATRRVLRLCAAATLLLAACHDGLLHEAAPAPVRVSLTMSVSAAAGGSAEAYASTNLLRVRFLNGEEVRLEETFAFDASAPEVRVPINVPLREQTELLLVQLELRRDADAVFSGSSELELAVGEPAVLEVSLVPVVSAISCGGPEILLDAIGATAAVGAAALFVTGDTVLGHPVQWNTTNEAVITAADGTITAVGEGTASALCSADGVSDSRSVRVQAAVVRVDVAPATSTLALRGTQQLTAVARDRLDNPLPNRTIVWSSTAPSIASVDQTGLATAQGVGTARIDATTGGVTGSATLTVLQPPPTVTTTSSSQITASSALLSGTVNPEGAATTTWFEYGTDPTLASFASSLVRAVGSGNTVVPMDTTVRNLLALTTYYFRLAASNAGGTARGQILNFRTAGAPAVRTIGGSNVAAGLQLNGAATPNGASTTVWFEWAVFDSTLAQPMVSPATNIGAGTTEVAFSYTDVNDRGFGAYVRAVAQNQYGIVRGAVVRVPPRIVVNSDIGSSGGETSSIPETPATKEEDS